MPVYSADPNDTFVSIYCSGTEQNPHDIWRIGSFYRDDGHSSGPVWLEHRGKYQEPGNDTLIPISSRVTARLDGDHHVTSAEFKRDPDALSNGDSRSRYRFECGVCKQVLVRRAEAVHPLFEKLTAVGMSMLSLNALAARL